MASDGKIRKQSSHLLSSRIARLIFASNLAGLAILIIGAMVLNEMRASFVVAKKQDLVGQAQVFSNLLAEGATFGQPQPVMDEELARATLADLSLPVSIRGKVYGPGSELIGDSYFLSDRVVVSALPPLQEPSQLSRWGRSLSEWAVSTFGALVPERGGDAVRTQTFDDEYKVAIAGGEAASQRFNDRGQRIISVSVPVQHVSAVVGVLTLESNDIDEIIRAERAALIPFIGVAVLVALITSSLLTIAIARPLRRLSSAADDIRSGTSQQLELPRITRRRDEIGALASSLEAMTEALFERITANERFAADVAHEIKNPLTSIRSAVETAERVQDNPDAMEKLHRVIAHDVDRLDRLITDISNASRLEAEITRVPTETLNIARFVGDIVSTYDHLAFDADKATVSYEDATMGAGLLVRGREGPLGQVVRNLIDNALSFSPASGTVSVRLEQDRIGPQTTARIIVEDTGPGVPEDKLEKIFDRFYTDRPKGSAFGRNSGLGLSIVQQIAVTHLGRVWAENRDAGGARFVVELPAS
jgi:two-component system sensor histidine kinase ChvG